MTTYCQCAACKDAIIIGDYQNVETAPMSLPEYDMDFYTKPWEPTPWWHPCRWLFRCDVRQLVLDTMGHPEGEQFWHYGRSRKVAHELLRMAYGEGTAPNITATEIDRRLGRAQ